MMEPPAAPEHEPTLVDLADRLTPKAWSDSLRRSMMI